MKNSLKIFLPEKKGKFYIDLQSGRQIQRLNVDSMTFSGDITFNFHDEYSNENKLTNEQIKTAYGKYFFNFAQLSPSKVIVDYEAKINSFFTIQYVLIAITWIN